MGQNAAAPGVPIGLLDVYNHHWNAGISMFIIIMFIKIYARVHPYTYRQIFC